MIILKEEINQSIVAILSLSKWKLVIVAVLAAIGLGLQKDIEHFDYGYLLLFVVPVLCAYVDMLVYERVNAIYLIAKYIREYIGSDKEMIELKSYENFLEAYRDSGLYFAYEGFAQLAGSLFLGISLPALAWARDDYALHIAEHKFLIVIPVFGIFAVVYLYRHHNRGVSRAKGWKLQ